MACRRGNVTMITDGIMLFLLLLSKDHCDDCEQSFRHFFPCVLLEWYIAVLLVFHAS